MQRWTLNYVELVTSHQSTETLTLPVNKSPINDFFNDSNCTNFNDRCVCVQCDAGLYSSDCSKACPAPAIAVATDTLLAAGGLWFFMAAVYYYYYSPDEEEQQLVSDAAEAGDAWSEGLSEVASSDQAKRVAAKARDAARKSLLRVRALFRIGKVFRS